MQLIINGKARDFPTTFSVAELLNQLGLTCGRVVVELNRNILAADHHSTTPLKNGDSLELIQFVGGG